MDLGRKMEEKSAMPVPAAQKDPKVSYPGFNLNDEIAKAFCKEYKCELGSECTATVKLKIVSLRQDEYGDSLGFDVISLDDIKESGADEKKAGEEKDEEKSLGYKRPKKAKEAPDISPKSFME